MSKVKDFGVVPFRIYYDDHEVHYHDDHQKTICPVRDEVIQVFSNKGRLDLYCPGCGEELDYFKGE